VDESGHYFLDNDYTYPETHFFRRIKDNSMLTSHELLLKFWHDSRYNFSEVRVEYVDRGAPGDRSAISGMDIRMLDAYYFEIASEQGMKYIPYHRIRKIMYDGTIIWER
jgi:uncharacterized protein (UPF0248 family)